MNEKQVRIHCTKMYQNRQDSKILVVAVEIKSNGHNWKVVDFVPVNFWIYSEKSRQELVWLIERLHIQGYVQEVSCYKKQILQEVI